MRSDLKLLARLLIDVRRTQNGPLVFHRGQWNRPSHARSGALCSFDDFRRRLIEHAMIVSLEPDSDFFVQHNFISNCRFSIADLTLKLIQRPIGNWQSAIGNVTTPQLPKQYPRPPFGRLHESRSANLSPWQSVRSTQS